MQNPGVAPAESKVTDLFVLSDEQILDIRPEADGPSDADQVTDAGSLGRHVSTNNQTEKTTDRSLPSASSNPPTGHESPVTSHGALEPPAWLAAQMNDPWGGEEAREFWDGVQQARAEAAAYRAAIASPEDARALKELYPGGVTEARAAAERGRVLDEIDRAYFGAAGNLPEQLSASRAQLAQRMLQEDPAAFREMVEAGIRVLQEAAGAPNRGTKSLASVVSDASSNANSPIGNNASPVGAQHAAPQPGNASANEAHVAAYAAFERAANEDLERSVSVAIERTLAQALPSVEQHNIPGQAGAQRAAPLRERLAASVRADIERALQGDRQLGEQVSQILAARRFDDNARAQVVRLIADRAQQLVPSAAKRVLNEWTQTTLAAHRGRVQRADATSARTEVAAASVPARPAGDEQGASRGPDARRRSEQANTTKSRPVNYRKLSDEQILEM
jgi:hypothetical protein